MAKRKKNYGSGDAAHRERAGTNLLAAKQAAKNLRRSIRSGNCAFALHEFAAFNRSIGRASGHRASITGQARSGWRILGARTLWHLEKQIVDRCIRPTPRKAAR